MATHDLIGINSSVEEACITAVLLEKAAQMLLLAKQFGEIEWTETAEALEKKKRIYHAESFRGMWAYFSRKLARQGA